MRLQTDAQSIMEAEKEKMNDFNQLLAQANKVKDKLQKSCLLQDEKIQNDATEVKKAKFCYEQSRTKRKISSTSYRTKS